MAIEIERKFIVLNSQYKVLAVPHTIKQGYICSEKERVVRIRTYDNKGFITLKTASIGFARKEFEYSIPLDEAQAMLEELCLQPIITKTRWVMNFEGHIWEIDEFHDENTGLVMAEIELEHSDETFLKPEFIGQEVTDDPRYYNARLFSTPYKKWKKQ